MHFFLYLCKNYFILELIHPHVQSYAEYYSSPEDILLHEITDFTIKNHPDPQMLSGHLQGKILEMISRMVQPDRILEIGTFTGYSAICLAKGLNKDGLLHTIELGQFEAMKAQEFFDKSNLGHKIILHKGNALTILSELDETWDLVFIDADKPGYIDYFNQVLPKVRKNGFILADNIFFHGEVLEPEVKGKNAEAIAEFNKHIRERLDIDKVVLTVRDGLYLIRKL